MDKRKQVRTPANITQPLGVSLFHGQTVLAYQTQKPGHQKLTVATSEDGFSFNEHHDSPVILSNLGQVEDLDKSSNFRLTTIAQQELVSYIKNPDENGIGGLTLATPADEHWDIATWMNVELKDSIKASSASLVPEHKSDGHYVMYFADQDGIKLATAKNIHNWQIRKRPVLPLRSGYFDEKNIDIIALNYLSKGIALLYQSRNLKKTKEEVSIGLAFFAHDNSAHLHWRSDTPIWSKSGRKNKINILGAQITEDTILIYFKRDRYKIHTVEIPNPLASRKLTKKRLALKRHHQNPIISPEGGQPWESVGTFNPAVLHHEDKVHILYRAADKNGVSYVGYAVSHDGVNIDYRHNMPCYWPRADFESGFGERPYSRWSKGFASGGTWGGCEDPKVTLIDGRVYMTYVGHSGTPGILLITSIDLDDFLNHRWKKWTWPKVLYYPRIGPDINPPFGESINKSAVIFPERINGKYVIFHRIPPVVRIHYADSLEDLGYPNELEIHASIESRSHSWDSQKLSIGSTPIRTQEGWLVIYHAVDSRDSSKYKIGAMLLDHNDPEKILHRTNSPILEPDMDYENDWKPGVAYPSGAAIINDTLHVYYGGGDKHVCVASANIDDFLEDLMTEQEPKLNFDQIVVS